jgi:hypothetical protein
MPFPCFSYPADVPPGAENRDLAQTVPPGPRTMPATACFSYRAEVPTEGKVPDPVRLTPPGLRRMPHTCFRY